jgi:hypothetical protein
VLLEDVVMMRLPSGLNCALTTGAVWALLSVRAASNKAAIRTRDDAFVFMVGF